MTRMGELFRLLPKLREEISATTDEVRREIHLAEAAAAAAYRPIAAPLDVLFADIRKGFNALSAAADAPPDSAKARRGLESAERAFAEASDAATSAHSTGVIELPEAQRFALVSFGRHVLSLNR